ncbi:toxin Cry1Ac domain D-VI-related protein [Enterococcus hirae]
MKKGNLKKNLVSFSTTSALVLSSLSGVVTPMVHADQNGAGEGIIITTSEKNEKKEEANQSNQSSQASETSQTHASEEKENKKVEETTTSSTTKEQNASSVPVPEQKNTLADEVIQHATDAVNNLFDGNGAKVGNTKAQIDAAKQQVESLPDSDQKTALLEKVNQAQKAYDTLMQKWQVANETMDKHFIDGDIGNPKGSFTTEEMIDLAEKLGELPYINIPFLEGYTTNELHEKYDQLIAVSNATPVVDRLFFNGKPSTNNTQNDINTALNLVHRLVDGPYKDRLLAKVQEAQKAYNDAHIIVLPKGNK